MVMGAYKVLYSSYLPLTFESAGNDGIGVRVCPHVCVTVTTDKQILTKTDRWRKRPTARQIERGRRSGVQRDTQTEGDSEGQRYRDKVRKSG